MSTVSSSLQITFITVFQMMCDLLWTAFTSVNLILADIIMLNMLQRCSRYSATPFAYSRVGNGTSTQ